KLQIRPWRLEDSDYSVDVNAPINLHLVVFVGGVPLEIRAEDVTVIRLVDLAHIMDRLFGNVAYAGIDTDFKYKYPRGAGRVAFTNYSSYIKAIKEQYVQLSHGDIETTVEIKPYVLDGQLCEKCIDEKNGGKYAPFFCPHLDCLQVCLPLLQNRFKKGLWFLFGLEIFLCHCLIQYQEGGNIQRLLRE
uniref:CEBP_ZZ domain-containing protein n=1 Tax=Angiostrongylus cantonensis TaxID=6313 RepID=A0A0K0D4W1_ANGCA